MKKGEEKKFTTVSIPTPLFEKRVGDYEQSWKT